MRGACFARVGSKVCAQKHEKTLNMIPNVKQEVINWNQKGTNTKPKGEHNIKNNRNGKHRPPEDEQHLLLGCHLVDLEVDLGADWILNGLQNLSFFYKTNIKSTKRVSRNAS